MQLNSPPKNAADITDSVRYSTLSIKAAACEQPFSFSPFTILLSGGFFKREKCDGF